MMGVSDILVPFYPIKTAMVIFSSDLKTDPLNLYPRLGLVIRSICASNFFGKVLGVQEDPNIGAQDLVVRGPIKGLGAVIAEK